MPATDFNLINQPAQWLGALTGGQLVLSPAAQLLLTLAGIFLFAVLPEFGLRVHQEPTGYDLRCLTEGTGQGAAEAASS